LEILIEQKLQTLIEHVEVFCVFSLFAQQLHQFDNDDPAQHVA
jgi:hypothetical protein